MPESTNISPLTRHAAERTLSVVQRVVATMKLLEAEIDQNDAVYPYNGGRLSRSEFCRRASIRPSVLDGDAHRGSTLVDLRSWLSEVHRRMAKGNRSVRRAVQERADRWKDAADTYAQQTHLYHLKMVSLEHKLWSATKRIGELEGEVSRLTIELSGGKVVKLRPST
jgi:hypothetical protein